jgi:hypothetical protein
MGQNLRNNASDTPTRLPIFREPRFAIRGRRSSAGVRGAPVGIDGSATARQESEEPRPA